VQEQTPVPVRIPELVQTLVLARKQSMVQAV
jgi:hypothetical protein